MPLSEFRWEETSVRSALLWRAKVRAKAAAPVISYVYREAETVYLLSVYDKSETENISDRELRYLIAEVEEDFK